ncbi:hypothetical protein [Janibacter sp. UYMM211]|uniref:hypothetical protein n=1 Tax=Janibacter sp. UYMM211 TaxID=3156342 RepID=UPI003393B95C
MTAFHPQDPDTWAEHALHLRSRVAPTPGDPVDSFVDWNLNIGPLTTDDTHKVAHAVAQAQHRNLRAPLTGRNIVVVDGPPLAGKTYATIATALEQTRQALDRPPQDPTCHRPRPWAYIEVLNHTGAKSIAQALAHSVGALVDRSAGIHQHVAAIRYMAPKVGLRGYIIDDSHGLLGARSRDTSSLATALKGLITGIPATAVVTGTNLRQDGIFQGTAGEQVRLSARNWVMCGDWPPPDGRTTTGWERLVRQLEQQLVFPGGQRQFHLATRQSIKTLAEGSLGRPGLAIRWATEAAVHAVTNDTVLDRMALEATARLVDPAAGLPTIPAAPA